MPRKLQLVFILAALLLALVVVPTTTHAQTGCSGTTHVVVTGENLYRIGLQYGISWTDIAAANAITDANTIYISQVLCIPSAAGIGGNVGVGGTFTSTTASTAGTVGGPVQVGTFIVERAANSPVVAVNAGAIDSASGHDTTATVILDATNNLLNVVSNGHIPNSQVSVYVSDALGDLSGGRIGFIMADQNGVVNGYVQIPYISQATRQYVMVRSYDRRMTWGYFDLGSRFP